MHEGILLGSKSRWAAFLCTLQDRMQKETDKRTNLLLLLCFGLFQTLQQLLSARGCRYLTSCSFSSCTGSTSGGGSHCFGQRPVLPGGSLRLLREKRSRSSHPQSGHNNRHNHWFYRSSTKTNLQLLLPKSGKLCLWATCCSLLRLRQCCSAWLERLCVRPQLSCCCQQIDRHRPQTKSTLMVPISRGKPPAHAS